MQTLVTPMPSSVRGYYADRPLMVTKETARGAFAKAVEWHVVERFTDVTISDGKKSYSMDEFSLAMAHQEIANTVEDEDELGPKGEGEMKFNSTTRAT